MKNNTKYKCLAGASGLLALCLLSGCAVPPDVRLSRQVRANNIPASLAIARESNIVQRGLEEAVRQGNLAMTKAFIEAGANPSYAEPACDLAGAVSKSNGLYKYRVRLVRGMPLLGIAAKGTNRDVFRLLVQHGASLDQPYASTSARHNLPTVAMLDPDTIGKLVRVAQTGSGSASVQFGPVGPPNYQIAPASQEYYYRADGNGLITATHAPSPAKYSTVRQLLISLGKSSWLKAHYAISERERAYEVAGSTLRQNGSGWGRF